MTGLPATCGLCGQDLEWVQLRPATASPNGYPVMEARTPGDPAPHAESCDANPFAQGIPDLARTVLGREATRPGGAAA